MGKRKSIFTSKQAIKIKQRRAEATPEERENARQKDMMRRREKRLNETTAETETRRERKRLYDAECRLNPTPNQTETRHERDRLYREQKRLNETPDETYTKREKDRIYREVESRSSSLAARHAIIGHASGFISHTIGSSEVNVSQITVPSEPGVSTINVSSTSVIPPNLNSVLTVPSEPSVSTINVSSTSVIPPNTNSVLQYIGPMSKNCPHCSALRFPIESLNCCHNGKVTLSTDLYPETLKILFGNRQFLQKIRSYNNVFAFASLGAQIANPPGFGPYCFRIHGQIYHRTSALHPSDGDRRRYGQVYIMDGSEAIKERSAEDSSLSEEVIKQLQDVLNDINPYASSYRHMSEVEYEENHRAVAAGINPQTVTMIFREGGDRRRYNAPSDEISAVFVGNDGAPPGNHDIVVYPRNQPLRQISYLNKHCDPMIYPVLFPTGQFGWDQTKQHNHGFQTASRTKLTQLQYYSYRLAVRPEFSVIHRAGKLLQQYIVDAYVKTEAERLKFIQLHQSQLRIERYQGLMDHIQNEATAQNMDVGKIVILPSSFVGSPRSMQQEYQDAMAIVSKYGRPDLFLTYTCNPKSREIVENLLSGQTASDRPDLVSRVFNLKLQELKNDLFQRHLLGKVLAHIYVIEFQKRGLPHAHMLLWLHSTDKLRTADEVDQIICAELPDPVNEPQLYEIVKSTMIHGPCGIVNGQLYDKTPCQLSGVCSKNFPKQYAESTNICINGYPVYRRRNDGKTVIVRRCSLDNRWVVPYNKVLTLRYGSHINLEACMTIKSVKYLFKYVYKGHDCINLEVSEKYNHDEVKSFLDARCVTAPEAMWRLSEFDMHGKSHCIIRLPVHLPEQQNVYFRPGNEEEAVRRGTKTQLTEFFALNINCTEGRQYLYNDIPNHFIFDKKGCVWKPRKRGGNKIIARMYSASPRDREKYCLRTLLLHVRGPMSYADLSSFNGVTYETFQEACIARGLMDDDLEWDRAITEAISLLMPRQCRQLFVTILTHCQPAEPNVLWDNHKEGLAEDFSIHLTIDEAVQSALADIESMLQASGMSCREVGLPEPNLVLAPEMDTYDDASIAANNLSILNDNQRRIVDDVWSKVENPDESKPNVYYIDGPAGTGKTMIYNTLISLLRSRGKQVASCAWTGIASILLRYGVTVHNLFKLPVPILETSTCNVSASSPYAEYLRSLSVIFIDEASMISNHALHAIDRLLKDVMQSNVPFGGKLLLFGGDFRQVLPVVVRGTATKILEQCLKRSPLWKHFHVYQLTENMRAHQDEKEFAAWLVQLGNGTLQSNISTKEHMIDIPPQCIVQNMVDAIFPDFNEDRCNSIILTAKNDTSLKLNDEILQRLPGDEYTFFSSDSAICDDDQEAQNYPMEFLNSITPTGMPPHKLNIKIGCTVMLLRNICSKRGLCNGVRLKVINIHTSLLHCEILTGSHCGQQVLIPRLKLAPSDANLPFILQRTQFPIRLCYSMTINKSQGQTFDHVGIFLPEPVFSHGQLYVAFSRARTLDAVKVQVHDGQNKNCRVTMNVVYKNILT